MYSNSRAGTLLWFAYISLGNALHNASTLSNLSRNGVLAVENVMIMYKISRYDTIRRVCGAVQQLLTVMHSIKSL